jgi:ABC-2 type transport system ATP-binding protein
MVRLGFIGLALKAISLRGVSKRYSNGTVALKSIDLDVERGDFFALLAPNGAGKSTAIGIVASLLTKSAGSVEVFGHDIDIDTEAAKACIGIVPQEFNFNVFESVRDIVLNHAGYYGIERPLAMERAEKYLRQLDLWDKHSVRSRYLSGGMQRRLMIARALVHEPLLLILDEPTAGVDIEIRRTMWRFLEEMNAAGTTIILTTHYLEEAESLCRNIAVINEGQIVEHSDMNALLSRLHSEEFVLNLRAPVTTVPHVADYAIRLADRSTIEVRVR